MPFHPVLLFPYLPIFPIFLSLPISLDVSQNMTADTEWFIFLPKPSLPLIPFHISWQLHHSPCLSGMRLFCISDAFHPLHLSFMFSLLPSLITFPLSPKLFPPKIWFISDFVPSFSGLPSFSHYSEFRFLLIHFQTFVLAFQRPPSTIQVL